MDYGLKKELVIMGVAATIGATLLGGWLTGRAQQQQYNAAAKQADTNAQISYNNAQRLQEQGEEQSQNNAVNEENKRRRMVQLQGQQRAAVGAAGVTASGSALNAMSDSAYNQEMELAIDRYNGRQKVDNYFQGSTDNVNQGDVYKQNAKDYRKAGKRALMNSMLMSGLSLAGNLYSGKSAGAQASKGASGSAAASPNVTTGASYQYNASGTGYRTGNYSYSTQKSYW